MDGFLLAAAAGLIAAQAPPLPVPPPPTVAATRAQPIQPLGSLFTMDDYPDAAFRGEAEGVVSFTLFVDARGMPSRCTVTRSSSNPDLDRATCAILMARARFTPARDTNGRAMEDRVSSRVRWVMPEANDFRLAFIPSWIFAEISLGDDGALHCRERLNAFEYADDGEGCGAFGDTDLPAMLRTLGAGSAVTLIITIAPDGMAAPFADGVDRGEPARSGAARLSVAPDGHVTDCRVTSRPIPPDGARLDDLRDLCRLPAFDADQMFRPDDRRTEVRGATLTLRLYVRRGGGAAPLGP